MESINKLFVYGSLAPGRPNEHILSQLGGTWEDGSVRGTLHQEGWGADMGYPGIILDPVCGPVEGFVFSSPRLVGHWKELDAFEGDAYQRVLASIKLRDGHYTQAYIYTLKPIFTP